MEVTREVSDFALRQSHEETSNLETSKSLQLRLVRINQNQVLHPASCISAFGEGFIRTGPEEFPEGNCASLPKLGFGWQVIKR